MKLLYWHVIPFTVTSIEATHCSIPIFQPWKHPIMSLCESALSDYATFSIHVTLHIEGFVDSFCHCHKLCDVYFYYYYYYYFIYFFLIKYGHCRLREEKFIKFVLHNATAT
jgi:hypothetical protein